MAAPTPVSALVHRSTLVTAGIWLLIRFNQTTIIRSLTIGILGITTLILARISATSELDTKKVVALSTLRQLGLMVFSLSIGGAYICLFHLLIHAFAKANLFLIVGNLIHLKFSQQETRQISSGGERIFIFSTRLISIFRLSGMLRFSGFFSKDFMLIRTALLINRVFAYLFLFRIISLTLLYCLKLFILLVISSNRGVLKRKNARIASVFPRLVLRSLRLVLGLFVRKNFFLISLLKKNSISLC